MSVLRQSGIILLQNLILVPVILATNALLARALGPDGNGVLLLLSGMQGVLLSALSFGLPSAAAYFSRRATMGIGQVIGATILVAGAATTVAGALIYFFIEDIERVFLGSATVLVVHDYWIWMTLALLFPALISSVGDVVMLVNSEMTLYVVKRTGSSLVHLLFAWLLVVVLLQGVTGELWALFISLLADCAVLGLWLTRKRVWASMGVSLRSLRQMLGVGLQQYGISLVALVAKRFDTFLIGAILSVRDAGFFSIPYLLYTQAMVIPQSTMWPMVSRMMRTEHDGSVRELATTTRLGVGLMSGLSIILGVTAPIWIRILFGEAFIPAVPSVWLILPTLVAAPVTISGNAWLTSRGQPGKAVLPSVLATVCQVVIGISLVPRIGIAGSSIALTANYLLVAGWMAAWMSRQGGFAYRTLLLPGSDDLGRVWVAVRRRASGLFRERPVRSTQAPDVSTSASDTKEH